ncbi:hypothetical protein L1887_63220 [Cichorium endivia]|nr:hypothetical protein L1887_63220 [Cichorium endivia]
MDSFFSKSNLKSDFKQLDKESKLGKQLDSSELNRSSKHIDSGVCVESLSSVSSILTSSSSLASSSSYSGRSTKQSHRPHAGPTSSLSPLGSASLITKDSLFESAELTDQYEYDYDEKEDDPSDDEDERTDEYGAYATSTNYDLIKEQELISKTYLLSNENLQDQDGNTRTFSFRFNEGCRLSTPRPVAPPLDLLDLLD